MEKPTKIFIALVVVSCLTSFLSSENNRPKEVSAKPPATMHIYNKLKCDSLEIEHRIKSINQILASK